jgi:hypothetical protein
MTALKKRTAGGSARWGNTPEGLAMAARELSDEGIRGFRNESRQRGRPPLYVLRGFQAFFNSMATMAGFQPAPGAKK